MHKCVLTRDLILKTLQPSYLSAVLHISVRFCLKKVEKRSSGIDSGIRYVDIANLNGSVAHRPQPSIPSSREVPQI